MKLSEIFYCMPRLGMVLLAFSIVACNAQPSAEPPPSVSGTPTASPKSFAQALADFGKAVDQKASSIDPALIELLFKGQPFATGPNPVSPMRRLACGPDPKTAPLEAFVFTDNLSVYLGSFKKGNSPYLAACKELYSNRVGSMEFIPSYGIRSVLVQESTPGGKGASSLYSLHVVMLDGKICTIQKLTSEQVPPVEGGGLFLSSEEILGNRYLVMEHSTDVVGSAFIYDLATSRCAGRFGVVSGSVKADGGKLRFRSRGKYLGDTPDALGRYEQWEYTLQGVHILDSVQVEEFVSH